MNIIRKDELMPFKNKQSVDFLDCLGFSGLNLCCCDKKTDSNIVEQISDTDFLVEREYNNKSRIVRISFANECAKFLYQKVFDRCYELSDDLLLFETVEYSDDYLSADTNYSIYSKSVNKELSKIDSLQENYSIVPAIMDDGRVVLHIMTTYKTNSGFDFTRYTIDAETFEPVTDVYSTFTNRYESVTTMDDVLNIVSENMGQKVIK